MQIVDNHTHVIADDPKYPRRATHSTDWMDTHAHDLEDLMPMLDDAGIGKALLVQASNAHGYDNSYTMDCVARFPQRFAGVGMFDPLAEDAVSHLRHWVERRGVRGARIDTARHAVNDPRTLPFWEALPSLGIPLVIMGIRPASLPQLAEMAQRFPQVKIVVDHLAFPSFTAGSADKAAHPLFAFAPYGNITLKVSTNMFVETQAAGVDTRRFFGNLIDAFGSERLSWGSNYPRHHEPQWPYKAHVEAALDLLSAFSSRDKHLVMGETAIRLWPDLRD